MTDLQSRLAAALAGRYTLERELGRGGMSLVYLAYDLRLDRQVALKILRPELAATLGPERFLREIKVVAGLAHPHILPLHDSGEAAGMLYYVMPYVEGESLRRRLERDGALPLADALAIAREVADALEYAHQSNVVHRDIKPENILLQAGHAVVSDFGIARAISAAGGRRVTATGIAVGTPDYMSPEQAAGTGDVDGRSDVYSLGCVVYEMLVGRPPYSATRSAARPPSVSAARPAVPLEVVLAIETAIAQRPEDRFARAAEFARALVEPGAATISGERRRRRTRRRWRAALVAAGAVAAAAVFVLPKVLGAGLNPALYVVVPFGHREGAAPTLLKGDQCELRVYDELDRWADVQVVNRFLVSSERQQRGAPVPTFNEAIAIARAVGSGMLIWGDLSQDGDSVVVRGGLYDVRHGGLLVRAHTIRLGPGLGDLDGKFRELADSLLLGRVQPRAAQAARSARYVTAWLAYARGDEALRRWDLDPAAAAFSEALAVNPDFPQANLWFAQARVWAGRPTSEWLAYATRALAAADSLSETDREVARGLVALGQGRYPDACDAYQRLVALDANDFVGWFGLGECTARDRLVVRDASSPSGWSFRSSQQAAITAYRRALELVPAVHRAFAGAAFARLDGLFYTQASWYRSGYALLPDTLRFAAHPGLAADTLTFVPHPKEAWLAGAPGTASPTLAPALAHNRALLRTITAKWVREFPTSADALEAHTRALETVGELAEAGDPERSALDAVRAARRAATESLQRLRLAAAEVRLLVKLERFAQARAVGDSILAGGSSPDPSAPHWLAGVAALTGRVNRAAALLAMDVSTPFVSPEGDRLVLPASVAAAGRALLVYAAVGAPAESLSAVERRVTRLVGSWVEPQGQTVARRALLHEPAMLAFPQLGAREAHAGPAGGNYLLELQRALVRDPATVRVGIARLDSSRGDLRAGDVAIEIVYQEAWLLVAVGDTAAAVERLDRSLTALPALGTALVDQVPQAAGLVRAMALRAELAAAAGDGTTAARWARAVTALWRDADPDVGAVVARMAALTSGNRR
ncbi:MAG TPA: serine/threonine-protein kinase [Gemmatimonadales bacterium]|nr:serine/threonine-protein kinase [Gemmatimonadales bacterium]